MLFGRSENKQEKKEEAKPRKKLAIGFDLRDDACQMSYTFVNVDPAAAELAGRGDSAAGFVPEPVTYAVIPGQDVFDIPTVLGKKMGENTWFYGREAVKKSGDEDVVFIPHLLSGALDGTPVTIENEEYDPVALLAMFISRCLAEVTGMLPKTQGAPDHQTTKTDHGYAVMFTARVMDSRMIGLLENVQKRLDLQGDVWYQNFGGAFYDFMLAQEPSLRERGSVLFEYEKGGKLRICKLFFNPRTTPTVSYEEMKEYPGLFAEDAGGRDTEFTKIIKDEIRGAGFSSAYLVGDGFKGGWLRKSAGELCKGRRVFLGNNLFSKGAAYGAAFRKVKPAFLQNYFFLDNNKLRANVLVRVQDHGEQRELTLLDAGKNWYEVHESADLVLDGTGEINLVLKPLTGGKEEPYHLRLDRLPVREGRVTRVRMRFDMPSADKLHLLIEDLGFGEIFPSSGLKWESVITV